MPGLELNRRGAKQPYQILKLLLLGGLLVLSSQTAFGDHNVDSTGYDYATVIDVDPVIRVIEVSSPREECWQADYDHRDRHRPSSSGVPTLVGGMVGGAIGHTVGHRKKNKQVGTVVGAVLGAAIGHAIAQDSQHHGKRCEVVMETHEEERIVGYDVRYRYNNRTYTARMPEDPGDTLRVRVNVTPIG